ncbi:MAG: uvrD [Candidatus Saccharibacteria bacterium]|nr:uvrD [Candidatus Saccharibacteria bacterium]
MNFSERYKQLNSAQKEAVDHIDGPVMVIAGPGTGKTELLSVRTANILSKTDTLPGNILCLTFTESGAAAMRQRLVGIIGKDAYKVAVHTFHSFGTEVINQNREYFYRGALFEPADDLSRYEILRGIFDELDYKNPLASTMNGEYTHQGDATKVISELKRSGLTSDELLSVLEASEAALDKAEALIAPVLSGTVSVKVRDALLGILPELLITANESETLFEIPPLARVIYDGLLGAIELSQIEHPTKPITAWKKKWLVKNEKGEFIFKSRNYLAKLRALTFVYYEYLNRMEQAGLYDYDDMILQVVHAMEVHNDLRFNLQEKYLYIMVDEFQDTNLAQMRILHNLTDNPANEGAPNVLVVGDDDQAIYSFQGADISNILRFKEIYPSASLVTLKDNYRSGEAIITESREVIIQGEDRLENKVVDLNKELTSQQSIKAQVELIHAPNIESERHWLVHSIAEAIKKGARPADIAVLTRRHFEIQSLLPYFEDAGITISYDRQENVLEQPPIVALELLATVVVALSNGEHDLANSLIPRLLAHPAWGITPKELWELSTIAYQNRQRWLDVMMTMPRFLDIHSWLIELAALSQNTALEPMIDRLIGRSEDATNPSPFFEYFFAKDKLSETPSAYLDCLAALRTIRSHLREYRPKDQPTLFSFIEFIALHRRLGSNLMVAHTSIEGDENAVNLMTAHRSKGLEFNTVYVFNSVDNVWGEKAQTRSRSINYPENLTLADAGGSADERLRLFYVAMTRAKERLVMSYSDSNDNDKSTLIASFLSEKAGDAKNVSDLGEIDALKAAKLAWYAPIVEPSADLKKILAPTLQNYKLSVTHLNAFIDISRGGPQHFLLDHLLHFPSAKSPSASYGSAVHGTLQQAHVHLTATGEQKPLEDILRDFEVNLGNQRLSPLDYITYHQKGSEQLQAFLAVKHDEFKRTEKSELNFAGQEAMLGEAHLTGMIDVVDINEKAKSMIVTDYKTGKPALSWKGSDDNEKIKLHKYRQQLMFYHLMIKSSRDYSNYTVEVGRLEFVEPTKTGEISTLEMSFEKEELERFEQLIAKIWERIINLDLPDVSGFDSSYKGVLAFEEALLNGNV